VKKEKISSAGHEGPKLSITPAKIASVLFIFKIFVNLMTIDLMISDLI